MQESGYGMLLVENARARVVTGRSSSTGRPKGKVRCGGCTDCEMDRGEREVEVPRVIVEHEVEGVRAGLQEVPQRMKGEEASLTKFRWRVRGKEAHILPILGDEVLRQPR